MKEAFTILIADRNPHVRGFLQREMIKEGYSVRLAENAQELLKWAFQAEPLDLIIVDPDLPDAAISSLLQKLQDRIPPVPVVVHTHYPSHSPGPEAGADYWVIVEKGGSSVERLKQVASDMLQRRPSQLGERLRRNSP